MVRSSKMSGGASSSNLSGYFNISLYYSFQRILRVHFSEIGHLNHLASRYTMASELSLLQARLDLVIDAYIWAIWLYQKEKAHIQHRHIILVSFHHWCL